MDSVRKSWGFRTFQDPLQENSSQGIEGNKGQKSTPLRRVVCPLERDDSSRKMAGITVRAVRRFLGRKTPKPLQHNGSTPALKRAVVSPKPVHSIKALPYRTVDITSEVALSTTLYVHIFAFDLVRAVRYAVNSVARESSLTQWSGASCICTLNRLGSPGVYNRQKAGTLVGSNRAPRRTTRFFDVLTAPVFQEKKP